MTPAEAFFEALRPVNALIETEQDVEVLREIARHLLAEYKIAMLALAAIAEEKDAAP